MRSIKWSALCDPLAHLFGVRLRKPIDQQPVSDSPRGAGSRQLQQPVRVAAVTVIPIRPITRAPKVDPIDQVDDHPDARRRERERCKAILSCAAASALPEVAQALAFETTLSRREAISMLQLPMFAPADRQCRA